MTTLEIITLIASVFSLALVTFLYIRSGSPVTVQGVQKAYSSSLAMAAELEKVGLMAVTAVEQLKETGRIRDNEEAFNTAFDYICSWPGFEKLDRKLVARAVEGSYHIYKQLREVQNESSERPGIKTDR